ncbi:ergothioneine biosynthesis protein EgtB [Halothece sp. PCC 7418]|uniref:ergothioneine biosynthesis protein EgtB n=1 Tax=Halothece sp. (strain PCC 7418) TaxID=65093 RepID=UPI0005A15AB3|nr:ergothioneine biosynthesis protein EgtB [Halothece sp. PCC 7418]
MEQFTSIKSHRSAIYNALEAMRDRSLEFFDTLDFNSFCTQAHPDFSPVGWHLGHIAFTEGLWILEHLKGSPPLYPQYRQLFAADTLPKEDRQNLPSISLILDYLHDIRAAVLDYLETAPVEDQSRLWWWLIQHECQHSETINLILQLQQLQAGFPLYPVTPSTSTGEVIADLVKIPAGEFIMGSDIHPQDNARPAHKVYLDEYWLDRYPVTCGQYRQFIEAGGYQTREWWSAAGWQWLQNNPVAKPLYWSDGKEWADHPVYGVSWYEAEAYANFVGKRLPTEAEWEKAARWHQDLNQSTTYPWGDNFPNSSHGNYDTRIGQTTPVNAYLAGESDYGCYDLIGNVWEWTADWFSPYPNFQAYPYRGYSEVYFDNQHRVLRGGSWATRPWALDSCWRNWYYPHLRQIFVGFRCAKTVIS